MGEYEDILHRLEGEARHFPPPPRHPGGRERLNIQKSSVCSRAYFVVVMAFFHLYIINIIALLLYVHYNTGSGEQDVPLEKSAGAPRPMPAEPQTPSSATLSPELSFRLPRLEGIRVHAPIHQMRFCHSLACLCILRYENSESVETHFVSTSLSVFFFFFKHCLNFLYNVISYLSLINYV